VTSFFNTALIPLLLHTLHSTISIGNTSSNKNIGNTQLNICKHFLRCADHCYEDILLLVKMEVTDSLLNIIEMYINEIKTKKILLNEEIIKTISIILFNTRLYQSTAGYEKEKTNSKIILMKIVD
jgi:hypothetical protein